MRQRYVKNQDELLSTCDKYISNPETKMGKWKEKLSIEGKGKYDQLRIEIGMGKGQFILQNAERNRNIKYVGIEVCKPVLALATKKIARYEEENGVKLFNLDIMDMDALKLEKVFKKGEVNKIYLNFSDPWPKKRHEKRRLTSDDFLKVYKEILRKDGKIEFKTDNRKLFEYSILNLNKNKVNMEYVSLDLHNADDEQSKNNTMTEYEEKFSIKGPIYKIIFSFNDINEI